MNYAPDLWKRYVRRFLTAQTISLLGSSLAQYAIVWHITLSTSSGGMLTLSTLCGFLPQLLISLFAGAWIDRYDRKKLILLADSLIALATLLLAVALFSGQNQLWLLLATLAVRSAGTGVQTPAVNAIVPQFVPQEQLMRVGGLQSTLSSLTMLLSPALGGALLSVAPLEAALFVDVGTAIIGVGITARIPFPRRSGSRSGAASYLTQIRDGLRYLRQTPLLRRLLPLQAICLFLISPSAFLTPLLVSRTFGPEPWRLAAGELTYSLGMVSGGLLLAAWGDFPKGLRTTLLAGGLYGALMLGMGLSPVFPLYLLCNTLIGITAPCYNTPITVTLQRRIPAALHGRVFALQQAVTSCALPLGMLLFGPLADRVSVQSLLLTGGGLVVLLHICGGFFGKLDDQE